MPEITIAVTEADLYEGRANENECTRCASALAINRVLRPEWRSIVTYDIIAIVTTDQSISDQFVTLLMAGIDQAPIAVPTPPDLALRLAVIDQGEVVPPFQFTLALPQEVLR